MRLSLRVHGTFDPGTGEKPRPALYYVAGMPEREGALIALRTDGRWALTRVKHDGTHSMPDAYATPQAALKALQELVDRERRTGIGRAEARAVNWFRSWFRG